MTTPEYDSPPINELVFSVCFKPLVGFGSQHAGLFWSQIRNNFPKSQQAAPLTLPIGSDERDVFPAPRYWFINEADDCLIQIQKDRFMCNWRKRDGDYPRFETVMKLLVENYEVFLSFLKEEKIDLPEISSCELTYINHMYQGNEWGTLADIPKILPNITYPTNHEVGAGIKALNLIYLYNLPDSLGELIIKLQTGTMESVDKELLLLELTSRVTRPFDNQKEAYDWFELAHVAIVNSFANLTDNSLQLGIWKKRKARK